MGGASYYIHIGGEERQETSFWPRAKASLCRSNEREQAIRGESREREERAVFPGEWAENCREMLAIGQVGSGPERTDRSGAGRDDSRARGNVYGSEER